MQCCTGAWAKCKWCIKQKLFQTLNAGRRGGGVDCLPVISLYLMLMSTSCLASLAPMVIPLVSTLICLQYFCCLIYCRARVSTNKYCCCPLKLPNMSTMSPIVDHCSLNVLFPPFRHIFMFDSLQGYIPLLRDIRNWSILNQRMIRVPILVNTTSFDFFWKKKKNVIKLCPDYKCHCSWYDLHSKW